MHQNANGLRARLRDGSFFETLDEHTPDVVLITEARSAQSKFVRVMGAKRKLTQRGYQYCAAYAGKDMGYAGCAVFSKIPFHFVMKGLETSNAPKTHAALLKQLEGEARVLTVEFANFSLVTCYSPNSGSENDLCRLPKRMAFEELLSYFLNRLDNPYVLVGDLNVARRTTDVEDGLDHPRYATHPGCTSEEREALETLIKKRKLFDLQEHSGTMGFTFKRNNPDRHGSRYQMRLDYVLPHEALRQHVSAYKIVRGCLSDHYGQIFEVDKSLFRALTPKFPEEMAAMEEETGNDPSIDVLKNVLHDIDNPYLPFFDTSPHPTRDAMDDEEEEEVMELCSSLSEYIDISSVLALDPNRSPVMFLVQTSRHS